jgi:hypothetical protein
LCHPVFQPVLLCCRQFAGAKVLDPLALSGAPQILQIKALTSQYTGYAFFVRAAAEADARAVAAGDLPRNHWFWSVVKAIDRIMSLERERSLQRSYVAGRSRKDGLLSRCRLWCDDDDEHGDFTVDVGEPGDDKVASV